MNIPFNALKTLTALLLMTFSLTVIAEGKTVGEVIDDNWILTKVKAALVGNETQNINVEVDHGEVLLAGFVSSQAVHDQAIEVTAGIKGVVKVRDHLYLHEQKRMTGETFDDGVIAGKVKAELARDQRTHGFKINVEVRGGVVLLSGFIHSSDEAGIAIELAQLTTGVVRVINGLEVQPS